MPNALISLQNITKVYNRDADNEYRALKGVDLTIDEGEFVAIMGPSGSGKTTLMNILGALDTPTSGKYLLRGQNVGDLHPNELAEFRNKQVGFVFQQFNLLPRFNVLDNVLLPTIYGQISDAEEKAKLVLAKVGLEHKMNSRPNQLSGGQVQRVAIARALIMSPAIIMADEPTGNLDSKTATEIMALFEQLNFEGNTIILVTHDEEVADYAKRTIKVRDGEVINSRKQK